MDGLSNSDVALLSRDNGMFGGDSGAFWIFALLLLAGGGFGGFGGNRNYVTSSELQAGFANQGTQAQLQQISLSSANNNYETAQIINQQTAQILAQNNTNLVNAIQGFNTLQQQIAQLGYHMDQCCCEIKTQMLQDRLADVQAKNAALEGSISNANQSQYLLGQLGRFVAWTPSGTQAASASA